MKNPFKFNFYDELDFDFRLETNRINTLDDFQKKILEPYESGKRVFYRGERRNSITRPLLPTLFRKKEDLVPLGRRANIVDSDYLCDYYKSSEPEFYNLFSDIIGEIDKDRLYPFLAFSQHYMGISPLIDFSKSPYPSLSFALKDRVIYDEDILLYTLEIKEDEDYTDSVETANRWLRDYSVLVFSDNVRHQLDFNLENPLSAIADYKRIYERFGGSTFLELNTPRAKLIDVPTNDLMLYQQGVFLLLDDFSLMGKSYLTKQIRDDFRVKKWLVNKSICPDLFDLLLSRYPYYAYDCIMDLSKVAGKIKSGI